MKTIKILFIVSLINFALVVGVISAFSLFKPISVEPTPDPLAGRCIVTVNSSRYDVTDFRNRHDGGDIFQCGANMTDVFNGQHSSSYLRKMARYKI